MKLGLIIEHEQAFYARTQQGGLGEYIPPCWTITIFWPIFWGKLAKLPGWQLGKFGWSSKTFRFGGLN